MWTSKATTGHNISRHVLEKSTNV